VELPLFDQVAEAVRGLLPAEYGDFRHSARRWGIKIWFDSAKPDREHYEAQVIGPQHVDDAAVLALEIGFHAEHRQASNNEDVIALLREQEDRWRPRLGDEAIAGRFLGGADAWRRLSETWPDPDLGDINLPIELAMRLTDYINALEPLRRSPDGGG
jgi:hypothetical protein